MILAAIVLASTRRDVSVIRIDRSVVIRRFDPWTAFGAGIDGHRTGENATMLSPENVRLMKSMGLRSLTYRLRTELGNEVWHWNPEGSWSDIERQQGYWTSSTTNSKPILISNGYRLPRRGNSIDQANRDDYSRLDDGDPTTFWKSNPYLDPTYTGIPYSKSPQWIVLDFKKPCIFNEIRFVWANPFPTRYRIEYLGNEDQPWHIATAIGGVRQHPGQNSARFAKFRAQMIKIVLLASSGTAPNESKDRRDGMGFAVGEISAGVTGADGIFHDSLKHGKSNSDQTIAYVSSTDPWHRADDLDRRTEQPGFDLMLERGLGQGQPILVPAGCLYDTPENVANEIKWLVRRGVKLRGVELGEEPDGNWVDADHYARLYMRMASAIRKVAPTARIGGPSFQTATEDYEDWPHAGEPWLRRFRHVLQANGRLSDFQFCSFEWYPFDNVKADPSPLLVGAPRLLVSSIDRLNRLGMSGMPWYVTEYGWSAYAAPAEVDLPGALFDFDVALISLGKGCMASFEYGYEPNHVVQEIPGSWGNLMAIMTSKSGPQTLPTYWTTWLLTQRLCESSGIHRLLRTRGGDGKLGAYAVRGPSGETELALVNRSPNQRPVSVATAKPVLKGWTYGRMQFSWAVVRPNSTPSRNLPPVSITVNASRFTLAPYSVTILNLGS